MGNDYLTALTNFGYMPQGGGNGFTGNFGEVYSNPVVLPQLSKAELDGTNAFGANSISDSLPLLASGTGTAGGGNWMSGFGDFMKGAVGTKEAPGWGGTALGLASGLASAYFGMQQYGLAKQQLAEGKRQFDLNFGAQKNMVNSQLSDRQRARVASNPGAYQSVGEYMNQYGVK